MQLPAQFAHGCTNYISIRHKYVRFSSLYGRFRSDYDGQMQSPDICIAGAGIIGLALALELNARGAKVTVFESGSPFAQASSAAAGMLAAHDPENPPALQNLADLSLSLYPTWLDQIASLSGTRVSFHTSATLQALSNHDTSSALDPSTLAQLLPQLNASGHRFVQLNEHSLDPRELASALLAAVRASTIDLHAHTPVRQIRSLRSSVEVHTPTSAISAAWFIDCTGAWAASWPPQPQLRVKPSKGQMLSLELPASLPLQQVVRTPQVYLVPRTCGTLSGRVVVGATVEDVGYDTTVSDTDRDRLHTLAAGLLPQLAGARVLESWAGLRPATPDHLPLIGFLPNAPRRLIAAGHYRNGILLAPATAHVMAQILNGEKASVSLDPFSPLRSLPESAKQ
jgi:glycine oxidase